MSSKSWAIKSFTSLPRTFGARLIYEQDGLALSKDGTLIGMALVQAPAELTLEPIFLFGGMVLQESELDVIYDSPSVVIQDMPDRAFDVACNEAWQHLTDFISTREAKEVPANA